MYWHRSQKSESFQIRKKLIKSYQRSRILRKFYLAQPSWCESLWQKSSRRSLCQPNFIFKQSFCTSPWAWGFLTVTGVGWGLLCSVCMPCYTRASDTAWFLRKPHTKCSSFKQIFLLNKVKLTAFIWSLILSSKKNLGVHPAWHPSLACAFPDQVRLHTAPFKGLAPKWGLGTIGFWTVTGAIWKHLSCPAFLFSK